MRSKYWGTDSLKMEVLPLKYGGVHKEHYIYIYIYMRCTYVGFTPKNYIAKIQGINSVNLTLKHFRSALFRYITQRIMISPYQRLQTD
jgi:hypothetical protein